MNKATLVLMAKLEKNAEMIVDRLVEAAKKGEPWAVKLAVEVMTKSMRVAVELPRVETSKDAAGAAAEVIDQAAQGELTVDEAKDFLALIEIQRRTLEMEDIEKRVMVLERETKRWEESEDKDAFRRRRCMPA